MPGYTRSISQLLTACAALSFATSAYAVDSIWSNGVGKILPSDENVWCSYSVSTVGGLYTLNAKFQKRGSTGALITDNYTDATTKLMVKMQCKNLSTGGYGAPISSGTFANTAQIQCPTNTVGDFVRCQIRSTDTNPFVYGNGTYNGDPCGDGILQISLPAGASNGFKGQVSGQVSELNFRSFVNNALFNQSLMTSAQVHGTDMGFTFYAAGKLWAGYGDTWSNTQMTSVSPTYLRGSVLFSGQDLDPSDANGLTFSSYVNNGNPNFAKEVVPCCHNNPNCNEVSAIPTAGFGIKDGANNYKVLWFDGIASWFPFTSRVASLAWSVNDGPWSRADQAFPFTGPRWEDNTHFGAGAIYHDKFGGSDMLGGMIYFFGQQPYRFNAPIRLARVKADFASIMDRTKYQYWNGTAWDSNPFFPLAPAQVGYYPSTADVIPASANAGPEFSVAFNGYTNRYMMLLVANRWTNNAAVQLWESKNLTGPWSKITSGAGNLPNANTPGGQWSPYNFFYGPYTNQQLNRAGGQNVYFQMSEWNGIPGFRPYNTGLWTFNVSRKQTTNCVP